MNVADLAEREGLTVRELLHANGGGHLQVVGTPDQVADTAATRKNAAEEKSAGTAMSVARRR